MEGQPENVSQNPITSKEAIYLFYCMYRTNASSNEAKLCNLIANFLGYYLVPRERFFDDIFHKYEYIIINGNKMDIPDPDTDYSDTYDLIRKEVVDEMIRIDKELNYSLKMSDNFSELKQRIIDISLRFIIETYPQLLSFKFDSEQSSEANVKEDIDILIRALYREKLHWSIWSIKNKLNN
jgi:hypothetical protein